MAHHQTSQAGSIKLRVTTSVIKYRIEIVIVLVAVALRAWQLDARALWFDEAVEYITASVPFHSIPRAVTAAFQPPFYSYVLYGWLKLGYSVIWLRSLSVIFSIMGLIGMVALAHRAFGKPGAIFAAVLMAVLPTEIRYAQEVGEYALMECLLIWSIFFFYSYYQEPRKKYLIGWAFFSLLSIYTQYGAAVAIAGITIATSIVNVWQGRWKKALAYLTASLAIFILVLPLILFFLPKQMGSQQHAAVVWMGVRSELTAFVQSIGNTLLFPVMTWPYTHIPQWVGLAPLYLITILSILFLFVKTCHPAKIVLVWFWADYLLYYLLVRLNIYTNGIYGFRYAVILVPVFVLMTVFVFEQIRLAVPSSMPFPKAVRYGSSAFVFMLALSLVVLAVLSLPNRMVSEKIRPNSAWPETEDVQDITEFWVQHQGTAIPTYVYYGAVPAFRYYLRLYGYPPNSPAVDLSDAACMWNKRPECAVSGNVFYGTFFRGQSSEQKLESMKQTFGVMPVHFWIVFSHIFLNEDKTILDQLSGTYHIVLSYSKSNAAVYLLEAK